MARGRVPVRPKLGYHYRTDSGETMYIIKRTDDPIFVFLATDPQGGIHRYTEKGRYFHGFGNHPLHLREEVREDPKALFYAMHGRKK